LDIAASNTSFDVAAVVLAAGGSARMGSPKQLLRLGDETLVRRAVRTALASRCARIFVVVGAEADAVSRDVQGLPIETVVNASWADGMASSIRAGVEAVALAEPRLDAVLLMLVDQPAITVDILDRIIVAAADGAELVACEYAGTMGAPALYTRRYFDALCRLRGDRGGKALLEAHRDSVARVPFEPAAVDIDTPADFEAAERLRRSLTSNRQA
jgi:molybdenum cofactor cytidylyltransferase